MNPKEIDDVVEPLVLVVEDEDGHRTQREEGLRAAGCQTIGVSSLEEAFTSLRDGPAVDLIVTDFNLGRKNPKGGLTLAMSVRSNYDSDLPMVIYSASVGEEAFDGVPDDLFVMKAGKVYKYAPR